MTAQEKARESLDRIEKTLQELRECLEQDKADLGQLEWGDAGELGYVAEQLEQVREFWTQEGEFKPLMACS